MMKTVSRLNREKGITIVHITHFMEEAAQCGFIYVMHDGKIAFCGTPRVVFEDAEKMRALRLDVPPMAAVAQRLRARGIALPQGILTVSDMVEGVKKLCS